MEIERREYIFQEYKKNPPVAGHIIKLMQFLVEEVTEWDEEAAEEIKDLFEELLEQWAEDDFSEEEDKEKDDINE